MVTSDFPAWPMRPHSSFHRNASKAASGSALPPRPRSAALGQQAGWRPRLRLGNRDGRASQLPRSGSGKCIATSSTPQAATKISGSASCGAMPSVVCERACSNSNASGSTRDTDLGGAISADLGAMLSSDSVAPSQDSADVFLDADITPLTASQSQDQLVPPTSAAAAAADAECAVRQCPPALISRPVSACSRPATRPVSANPVAQAARRLPLTSIAFATQARPRTAGPARGDDDRHFGARSAAHIEAAQAALAKRKLSEPVLRKLPQDQILAGKYRTLQYLGRGTSATVWEAIDDETGDKFAIKVFDKHKGNWANRQKQAVREARLLQNLNHRAIARACGTVDAPMKFHIIMELVVGSSLRELISRQPSPGIGEVMSRGIFEQICDGVHFCHSRQIVHRDLKLENILLESSTGQAKIIDFGFALQLRSADQRLRVFCGTPSYMAPELVMGKEYSGFSTDMWALGIVLFAMLSGRLPFEGQTESQLYAKIRRGIFRFPDGVSDLPRRVVAGILRIDALSRPTAAQALQHQWVRPDVSEGGRAHTLSEPSRETRVRPSSVPASMRRMRTAHT